VIGPLRNCELTKRTDRLACTAGQPSVMRCTRAAGAPQFVRVCESSASLGGVGVACRYEQAISNTTIEGTSVDIAFTCPAARPGEPGGAVSIYSGAVFQPDGAKAVSCTVL
jgi:hypothetical protein